MTPVRVLVNSPDREIGDFLKRKLSPLQWEITTTRPGPAFVEAAQRERPEIAVIDRIHERPEAAQVEIAVLKNIRPEVRIIALSGDPSREDVRVVERGVFYYLAQDWRPVIVDIVQAASRSCREQFETDRGKERIRKGHKKEV